MRRDALSDSLFIGKGNERLCYIHPEDATKVIKIAHKHQNARNQNAIEAIYNDYLEKRGIDFSHLTRCYGWIDIGETQGLVFDRVINSDGSKLFSLSQSITEHILDLDYHKKLLKDLENYLQDNCIIFADVSLDNVMCAKQKDGSYKLIIVDGLGARRLGLKFWLYRHVMIYTKYKLKHQWKKVMQNFNNLQEVSH